MKQLRVGDLFSGIGGFSLGLERAGGFKTQWFVEIDPYCQRVLAKHWPDVQRYGDIKTIDWGTVEPVDVVCGGFPCQPFSLAGKRRGTADDRYLWPAMLGGIQQLRPTWIIGENVPGLVGPVLDTVLADLEAAGYAVQTLAIPACAFDAPHIRQRIWIVAYANQSRSQGYGAEYGLGESRQKVEIGGGGDDVADSNGTRQLQPQGSEQDERRRPGNIGKDATHANRESMGWPAEPWSECRQWEPEPELGGRFNGIPNWLDRFTGGLSYAESRRSIEALRVLWSADVSEALWQTVGGYGRVEQAAVLFAFVREYEKDADQARLLMACQKAFEEGMRRVRRENKRSSRRSGQPEQSSGEYSDALQMVPQLSPCDGETPWACDSWEDGIARVAHGIPHRVDRLRGLGNAVVPQIVHWLGEQIIKVERENLHRLQRLSRKSRNGSDGKS